MPTYRLGEGANAQGWPYLRGGHAYLADGMPLTEADAYGRVKPAQATLAKSKATCSGGLIGLADRQNGIEALARALDKGDPVRASLLLLFLQIDPPTSVAKYNPYHRPSGPAGGQFTTGPQSGNSASPSSGFHQVASLIDARVYSTYEEGLPGREELDAAHRTVTMAIYNAILLVDRRGFRPGMPGYGQQLHWALTAVIKAANDPNFHAEQVYLWGYHVPGNIRVLGSSVPDIVYGPLDRPLIVFELKTGSAADTSNPAVARQRDKTLNNMPGEPDYDYFLVR